jgi:uncharacterized protein
MSHRPLIRSIFGSTWILIVIHLILTISVDAVSLQFFSKYLTISVTDPIIQELIASRAFQRLEKIHQYGIDHYCMPSKNSDYTRKEHSERVYEILRRFGANLDEQIAGLLHDTSHTVFSHVGDFVFGDGDSKDAYQDIHHIAILGRTDIASILQKNEYPLAMVDHKSGAYPMLEQELPDLCADRIEYILTAGILEDIITPEQAACALDDLAWDDHQCKWYAKSEHTALTFGYISLYNTEYVWGSAESQYYSYYVAQAIKHGLKTEFYSYNDIWHGTDDDIWQRLITSTDPTITALLQHIRTPAQTGDPLTRTLHRKFRGVDPLVAQSDGSFIRLTQLNPAYKQEFERVKKSIALF